MFSSYYDWNNFATDKNPALTLFIVQNFPLPSFHSSFNIVKYTTNKQNSTTSVIARTALKI